MVASADTRKPRRRNSSSTWPLTRELAVQTLYLTQGLSPKQIAEAMGEPVTRIHDLVQRRGWTTEKRARTQKSTELSRTRTQEHVERVVQAQAAVAEAASVAGLQRALSVAQEGSALSKDDANAFRAWAGGSRELVQIMRQARGLADPGKSDSHAPAGGALTLNMFVVQSARDMKPIERNANLNTPAIEVQAKPVGE